MMTRLHNNQNGFTLLEVMIALVIFSIGLLGLAGLQSAGMRNNQISYSRTYATQLAYDLADRIRNNNPDTAVIDYSTIAPNNIPNCLTNVAGCTAAQMAAFDLYEWNTMINDPMNPNASPLKNATGFIALNNATNTYTISIGWDEGLTGAVPANCNLPLPNGVACVTIQVRP